MMWKSLGRVCMITGCCSLNTCPAQDMWDLHIEADERTQVRAAISSMAEGDFCPLPIFVCRVSSGIQDVFVRRGSRENNSLPCVCHNFELVERFGIASRNFRP